ECPGSEPADQNGEEEGPEEERGEEQYHKRLLRLVGAFRRGRAISPSLTVRSAPGGRESMHDRPGMSAGRGRCRGLALAERAREMDGLARLAVEHAGDLLPRRTALGH